jgi:hypothetical protein
VRGGTTGPETLPPFLETAAPPWAARGLASVLLLLFVVTAGALSVVRVPETVTASFVLAPRRGTGPVSLHAELLFPQEVIALVQPGQRVKLLYDAFPYQRYGVKAATLRWISPSGGSAGVQAFAEIDSDRVLVNGEPRALGPGLGGTARVIVGRRTLLSYAIEPIRRLRENFSAPPQ